MNYGKLNCVETKVFKISNKDTAPMQGFVRVGLLCRQWGRDSRTEREMRGRCSLEEWLVEVFCLKKQLIVPFPTHLLYSYYTKSE